MALLLAATFPAACAGPKAETPARAEITETVTATFKVVSVDQESRLIVLRGEKGDTLRVHAGPEVRNFAQIAPGNTVRVDYQASLAVALKKPDEESEVSIDAAAARAGVGERPAGGIAAQVTTTVRIESVDTQKHIVVFTPPRGGLQAAEVRRPEGREFLRSLRPGDRVQITYTEALALRVEKQ